MLLPPFCDWNAAVRHSPASLVSNFLSSFFIPPHLKRTIKKTIVTEIHKTKYRTMRLLLLSLLAALVAAIPPFPSQCCCCHMDIPALVCKLRLPGEACFCSLIACPADVPTIYEGLDRTTTVVTTTPTTTSSTSSETSSTTTPATSSTFTPEMPGSPPGTSSSTKTSTGSDEDEVPCCCCDTGARIYRCGMIPKNMCYCKAVVCPAPYKMVWDM